jgi:nucleoid-associated protein YgaU
MNVKILLDMFAIPPTPPEPFIEILHMAMAPTDVSVATGDAKAPTVMFGWGPNIVMEEAYIKSMSVTYKRFLLGVPVRAEVTVGLEAVPPPSPLPPTNPTSGGLATRRTRTVVEGDSLASVAYEEYRDPTKWRALAIANALDDPMRLKPGTVLIVPDSREAETLS